MWFNEPNGNYELSIMNYEFKHEKLWHSKIWNFGG